MTTIVWFYFFHCTQCTEYKPYQSQLSVYEFICWNYLMICFYSSWGLKCFNKSYFGKLGHEATISFSFYTWLQNLFINHITLHCTKSRSPSILKWMNECLTTPQHKNKSAIGCQTNGIYIKRTKSNVYKLNHRSAPDCTWQNISPKLCIRTGLVYNGSIAQIVTVNWIIRLQCSVYYSCTLGEQSPKTRFQGEFCISHSTRWGYHHSPCDSLSLLLRYIILIFNYSNIH